MAEEYASGNSDDGGSRRQIIESIRFVKYGERISVDSTFPDTLQAPATTVLAVERELERQEDMARLRRATNFLYGV